MKFLKYLVPFLAGLFSISTAYSQNTVYVIHGYGATVDNHWFKYIKHNLEDSKTSVYNTPQKLDQKIVVNKIE